MSEHQQEPMVIVSVDSHVGPRLAEDLRPYCPKEHLEAFDELIVEVAALKSKMSGFADFLLKHPNVKTAGHHESAARLADYDYDGVAAAVLFHASQNFEPMPFSPMFPGAPAGDRELMAVGMKIYNRWLVDFVAQAPLRHIGLAYLPMWDIERSITEAEWAHDHGLKGVNFPALRDGELLEYNDRAWDPFWSVCAERKLPLVTHVGATGKAKYEGPEATAIKAVETGGFYSHRAVWWLIFGGVFERHPALKHVITETPGSWYAPLAVELDAIWNMFSTQPEMNAAFYDKVPRAPSEYMRNNVFFGASFTSPHEAEQAVLHGFERQLLWGSDYPHLEGTFVNPEGSDMPSVTKLALRNTFCHIPPEPTRRMVADNAIEVYDLDPDALQDIAVSIGAPTAEDLTTPIDAVPDGASLHAFRSGTSAWS
jgi:predicted TIM-barrel fold metal-dependent hydrolase